MTNLTTRLLRWRRFLAPINQCKFNLFASVFFSLLGLAPSTALGQDAPSLSSPGQQLKAIMSQGERTSPDANTDATLDRPPSVPNPYVSLLPEVDPGSYQAWSQYLRDRALSSQRRNRLSQAQAAKVIREKEKNDTQSTAQRIKLSSAPGQPNRVLVKGVSGAKNITFEEKFLFGKEDDGSIPLTNQVKFDKLFQTATYIAAIGDGPFGTLGTGSGDHDFYRVHLKQEQVIEVRTTTLDSLGDLDPVVIIFNADGQILAFNTEISLTNFDNFLRFAAPSTGDYYVSILGFGSSLLQDINDSGSGLFAGSEGLYKLDISFYEENDPDFFAFKLEAGDVFGAAITGRVQPRVSIFTKDGDLQVSSASFATIQPEESPLPTNGQTIVSFVAPESGLYAIEVSENLGPYDLELFVTRPYFELNANSKQILFIDFTGAKFDAGEFFGGESTGKMKLSPFGKFLKNWGIKNNARNRTQLAVRIVEEVRENIEEDLRRSGVNRNFEVEIISDFANKELAKIIPDNTVSEGEKVSRVIVGGTIEESGIGTIGIAQSIDPGNFATEETALVLLDILSAPAEDNSFSLNGVTLAPGKTIEDLVVTALGNIISHEAGHYLGNFHTDGFNDTQTLMDEGPGGLFNLIGVGPSGVFGADDQTDVDFITDDYSTLEGLSGRENTQTTTAFALSFVPAGNNLIAVSPEIAARTQQEITPVMRLSQSYPNPQAPTERSQIGFTVPTTEQVSLDVYDIQGNRVANLFSGAAKSSEVHEVELDAQKLGLRKGVYVYKLKTSAGELQKRIIITE